MINTTLIKNSIDNILNENIASNIQKEFLNSKPDN